MNTNPVNPHIFRAYDIRGIADPVNNKPADLTPKTAYLIGKAVAIYLRQKYKIKNIAVGCDNRLTSKSLKKNYIKGLIENGLKVTDVGLVTSPMIYWAACALDFDAGTNITASHNPKEYNGFKIVTKNAHSICGEELQKILKIILTKKTDTQISKKPNPKTKILNIWPKYLKDITSRIKFKRSLKVVIDAGNGAAGKFAPKLLRSLGCKVIELYCNLDGNFPNHEANPEELHNMQDLIKKVLATKSDIGIGFDGDGDRVGVVDEKGHMYSSDFMLLLLARDLLTRMPNSKIVFDVKISQAIINDLKKHSAIPVMSKVGHSFIESKMKEIGAPLAGEVSGHLFFAENYYGFDDALFAAAKILEVISKSNRPLSEFFNDLPKTFTTPEFKAFCPDDKKFQIVKKLTKHFLKLYDCITIDGVRINFDKNSWGAVRASNTSPNLTLRFEAKTPKRLKEIQKIMITQLKKYPKISLSWYKNNAG